MPSHKVGCLQNLETFVTIGLAGIVAIMHMYEKAFQP